MSGNNSVVNLGDISKPATVLIEKISDAVGGIFKPYQIVRVATAEAEADRILSAAKIEITELQQRAMHRFLIEEAKHRSNIEQITAKAVPLLKDEAQPENVDDDWIANFFDKCRIVADADMQLLWSRVLAGEANTPGMFSRKTVNLMADLDKSAAEIFMTLTHFRCDVERWTVPIVLSVAGAVYERAGLKPSAFADLESLGLIRLKQEGYFFRGGLPQEIQLIYFNETLKLELPKASNNRLLIGRVLFTKAGRELSSLCGSIPVDGFVDYLQEQLRTNYRSSRRLKS